MQSLDLFMRWLHIFSVITAVGSAIFMRFVLFPSLASLRDEDKATLSKNVAGRARIWIHAAITGILISGLYNLHKIWSKTVFPYGFIFTLKLVLAMIVFMVAILLTSSSPQRASFQSNRKTWLTLNVGLAVIIVALSAFLRALH
jgi:uncharacterized membrane protein